jgi:hypothetical protein
MTDILEIAKQLNFKPWEHIHPVLKAIRAEALQEAYASIVKLNQMAGTSVNDDYLIGYGFGVRDCQIKIEAILNEEAEK